MIDKKRNIFKKQNVKRIELKNYESKSYHFGKLLDRKNVVFNSDR